MALFLRIYQHLLPRCRAWAIVVDKTLRRYMEGLTGLPSDIRDFIDLVLLDLFPATTRELTAWEAQLGVTQPGGTTSERRAAITAAWNRGGGQGPDTLQEVLQSAGFPLYVHEAWYFTPAKAIRNPNLYLVDGDTDLVYVVECGEAVAECGEPTALCGDTSTPAGILLVNKILRRALAYTEYVTCGEALAECGEIPAECGDNTGFTSELQPYVIPSSPELWPYFWYIGGATFGDSVTIPASRKQELEALILRIGPAQLWTGLFVDYT